MKYQKLIALINHFQNEIFKQAEENEEYDYRMQHRAPGIEGAPLYDLKINGVYPDDVYETLNYYNFGETDFKKVKNIVLNARNKPDYMVSIYRAVPRNIYDAFAKEGKLDEAINSGDWVSISKEYAKDHGKHYLDESLDMPILTLKVPAKNLFTDGNSLLEWGYVK